MVLLVLRVSLMITVLPSPRAVQLLLLLRLRLLTTALSTGLHLIAGGRRRRGRLHRRGCEPLWAETRARPGPA